MNTTPTKRSILPVWWAALVAMILVSFAAPSMVARLYLLSGDELQLSMLQGEKLGADSLDRLENSRRSVAAWFPHNVIYNDVSMVLVERAANASANEDRQAYLKEALAWQKRALFVSPADTYGWYRLAYILSSGLGPTEQVVQAWKLSLMAAPYEPRLSIPQVQMAAALYSHLGEDGWQLLPRLVQGAWHYDPDALVAAAQKGAFVSIISSSLKDDAVALSELKEKLEAKPETQ